MNRFFIISTAGAVVKSTVAKTFQGALNKLAEKIITGKLVCKSPEKNFIVVQEVDVGDFSPIKDTYLHAFDNQTLFGIE